eukprot:m.5609 g.5609  ORF g.5609 m.5609 type:complete len:375 (-) comp2528_c0_seq2:3369-4493(-)
MTGITPIAQAAIAAVPLTVASAEQEDAGDARCKRHFPARWIHRRFRPPARSCAFGASTASSCSLPSPASRAVLRSEPELPLPWCWRTSRCSGSMARLPLAPALPFSSTRAAHATWALPSVQSRPAWSFSRRPIRCLFRPPGRLPRHTLASPSTSTASSPAASMSMRSFPWRRLPSRASTAPSSSSRGPLSRAWATSLPSSTATSATSGLTITTPRTSAARLLPSATARPSSTRTASLATPSFTPSTPSSSPRMALSSFPSPTPTAPPRIPSSPSAAARTSTSPSTAAWPSTLRLPTLASTTASTRSPSLPRSLLPATPARAASPAGSRAFSTSTASACTATPTAAPLPFTASKRSPQSASPCPSTPGTTPFRPT